MNAQLIEEKFSIIQENSTYLRVSETHPLELYLGLNELVKFRRDNPSIMKRPIILNERSLVVGYDDDEITSFVPSEIRKAASKACNPNCANYAVCGYSRRGADC